MTRQVLIIKTGSTVPELRDKRGDFEDWIIAGMAMEATEFRTASVFEGDTLPPPDEVMGVVVTGSPAMVTDRENWSEYAAGYLRDVVGEGLPVLGICYGHQLLAHALGGEVGANPGGREIGSHEVRLNHEHYADLLFKGQGALFPVHTTHSQSVLRLPEEAVALGSSELETYQAVRYARLAWGVQFHPEFDADIMRGYLEARYDTLVEEGLDAAGLLADVRECPEAARILGDFADIIIQSS